MITLTDQAAETVRTLCTAAGADPTVRIHGVRAGTPTPVEITTDHTDHRPGDLVVSSRGVVVLVDGDLAALFHGHALTTRPDDEGAPHLYLCPAEA